MKPSLPHGRGIAAVVMTVVLVMPVLGSPAQANSDPGVGGIITAAESGAPLTDACVTLYSSETDTIGPFCTDSDGRYFISGEHWGDYRAKITAPGRRTQWYSDAPDYDNARNFGVPQYSYYDQHLTLGLGSGVVAGAISNQDGTPASVTVVLESVDQWWWTAYKYTWIDPGKYRFENIAPGRYRVKIETSDGPQWIPGADTAEQATVFEVTDGGTIVADDRLLPLGTLEVRVTDEKSGMPVPRACVYLHSVPQSRDGCGADGVVRLTDLPPGDWAADFTAYPTHFPIDGLNVTVQRGKTTKVDVRLRAGAAVVTKVVDAATGTPIDAVCVELVSVTVRGLDDGNQHHCSGKDGVVTFGPFEDGGKYEMFAWQLHSPWFPPAPINYGAQWVGKEGGTGDRGRAQVVKTKPRQVTTVAPIKMDLAGSIAGTVREAATGNPLGGVCAYPYAYQSSYIQFGPHCSRSAGNYVIKDLGPYEWPVQFMSTPLGGWAWQWSGNVADRYHATTVKVIAGQTVNMDAAMVKGGKLEATLTGAGNKTGQADAFNIVTGDPAGPGATANLGGSPKFTLTNLATQSVFVRLRLDDGPTCWYGKAAWPGGPIVPVPVSVVATEQKQLAFDLVANCAQAPDFD